MSLVICPAASLAAICRELAPSHVIRLSSPDGPAPADDRSELAAVPHRLALAFHDIAVPRDGLVMPARGDMAAILAFGAGWDGTRPLVVSCQMGISRSTAAAFAIDCARHAGTAEAAIAARLRRRAPAATPNPRLVALADDLLGRDGRMVRAIEAIGRGADYAPYHAVTLPAAFDWV